MRLDSPGRNLNSPSPGKNAGDYSMIEESIYYENSEVFDESLASARSMTNSPRDNSSSSKSKMNNKGYKLTNTQG